MRACANGSGVAAVLAVLGVGFLFGHGCGSVTNDRDDAINQATTATCNRYQACGLIGQPSDSYPSISDCQADWKGRFTKQWPPDQCQGHIDHAMLNVCVDAINSTSCTNILDVLTTFYVKCSPTPVCHLPPDAGHD